MKSIFGCAIIRNENLRKPVVNNLFQVTRRFDILLHVLRWKTNNLRKPALNNLFQITRRFDLLLHLLRGKTN